MIQWRPGFDRRNTCVDYGLGHLGYIKVVVVVYTLIISGVGRGQLERR